MPQTSHAITLSGSVETVTEYLGFAINSILYQRGIYPADSFQPVRKYGISLMISTNEELNAYLANLLRQIALWLAERQCRVVALLMVDPATDAVLERWEFLITEEGHREDSYDGMAQGRHGKSEDAVRKDVQAVLRQITSCVSFLPVLPEPTAFDVVVYTTMDVSNVPAEEWEASGSRLVNGGVEVRLKEFSTGFHKVDSRVAYRE